jgi:hypothetical protein
MPNVLPVYQLLAMEWAKEKWSKNDSLEHREVLWVGSEMSSVAHVLKDLVPKAADFKGGIL